MMKINFADRGPAIKPMHGVGQPPFSGMDTSMIHYLGDAGIPFSRLHDVGGALGGGMFVDVPNVFPDFDADVDDPNSYIFGFTDHLLASLVKNGVEPFYRLGVTIENYHNIHAYRIFPPKDNLKWAQICEHIIRHYTEGWANGFRWNIRYWEIWNEPDNSDEIANNPMWKGTMQQYFDLYGTASKYLKERFPHLKIGGYASCGFYAITGEFVPSAGFTNARAEYFNTFFDEFLKYVKADGCPLDFFSWHSYDSIKNTGKFARYAREQLDKYGFTDTETTCNEWNCAPHLRGTAKHAAYTAAMLCAMQQMPLDSAMFYDARFGTSMYGGLFNPMTGEPLGAYYAFVAFNELYKLGREVSVEMNTAFCADAPQVEPFVLAARSETKGAVLVVNATSTVMPFDLRADGALTSCRLTDKDHTYAETAAPAVLPPESFVLLEYAL